jgi:hypothetical protein
LLKYVQKYGPFLKIRVPKRVYIQAASYCEIAVFCRCCEGESLLAGIVDYHVEHTQGAVYQPQTTIQEICLQPFVFWAINALALSSELTKPTDKSGATKLYA